MLYELVRENLGGFLAHARESYEAPLPKDVEAELRLPSLRGLHERVRSPEVR